MNRISSETVQRLLQIGIVVRICCFPVCMDIFPCVANEIAPFPSHLIQPELAMRGKVMFTAAQHIDVSVYIYLYCCSI